MTPIPIIIDTREQRPWSFSPDVAKCRVETLKTGDYAIVGDDGFAIERKSLDDFLATISSGWERFLREIDRMKEFAAKVIIVEGDFVQFVFRFEEGVLLAPDHCHPNLTPQFVMKRVAQLSLMGVSVLFAKNSELAAVMAFAILKERHDAIN